MKILSLMPRSFGKAKKIILIVFIYMNLKINKHHSKVYGILLIFQILFSHFFIYSRFSLTFPFLSRSRLYIPCYTLGILFYNYSYNLYIIFLKKSNAKKIPHALAIYAFLKYSLYFTRYRNAYCDNKFLTIK